MGGMASGYHRQGTLDIVWQAAREVPLSVSPGDGRGVADEGAN